MLAGFLASAGLGYVALLVVTYLQITSSRCIWPDLQQLDAAFFRPGKSTSTIERLLESTDGPMNRAGTMRPAFTEQSAGWESITANLSTDEQSKLVTEREGERLALLAWIRSGPSRDAFEADDFQWRGEPANRQITRDYVSAEQRSADDDVLHARIRSIIMDRCVTCHGENGRHELARWIPLDTYENIERHCRPEDDGTWHPPWPFATLTALLPLTLVSGSFFHLTSISSSARPLLTILPSAALAVAGGTWVLGQPTTNAIYVLLGAAGIGSLGVVIQIAVSVSELIGNKQVR